MPRHGISIAEHVAQDGTHSYRIHYGIGGGRYQRETLSTRELAEQRIAEIEYWRTLRKLPPGERGRHITVSDYIADQWWPARSPSWKPGTPESYRPLLANWCDPYIGASMLGAIDALRLDALRDQLQRDGAGVPTINKLFAVLEGVWTHALERGLVETNPFAAIKPLPHRPRTPSEPIELRDVLALWRVMEPLDGLAALLVGVLALRQQELWPLTWRMLIDRQGEVRETLKIRYSVSGGVIVDSAKTPAGEREVEIPAWLRQLIGRIYALYGKPSRGRELFATTTGKRMTHKVFSEHRLAPAQRKVGLVERDKDDQPRTYSEGKYKGKQIPLYTPHDLRDVAPAVRIKAGWDLQSLKGLMGHASITTTERFYWNAVQSQKGKPTVSVDRQLAAALKAVGGHAEWETRLIPLPARTVAERSA